VNTGGPHRGQGFVTKTLVISWDFTMKSGDLMGINQQKW
jgi:hypothetical protein